MKYKIKSARFGLKKGCNNKSHYTTHMLKCTQIHITQQQKILGKLHSQWE